MYKYRNIEIRLKYTVHSQYWAFVVIRRHMMCHVPFRHLIPCCEMSSYDVNIWCELVNIFALHLTSSLNHFLLRFKITRLMAMIVKTKIVENFYFVNFVSVDFRHFVDLWLDFYVVLMGEFRDQDFLFENFEYLSIVGLDFRHFRFCFG